MWLKSGFHGRNGEKVVAIPLDLRQELETSNQGLEDYGFKITLIKPFEGNRYINTNSILKLSE